MAAYIGLSRLENPMSIRPTPPKVSDEDAKNPPTPTHEEPGTNAVEHEPDPQAEPLPDGHHKYVPRSPFTAGNT